MLRELDRLAPEAAQGILARATLDLLRHPFEESPAPVEPDELQIRKALLAKLDEGAAETEPSSATRKTRLAQSFANEIQKLASRRLNLKAAHERSGDLGLLAPSEYQIRFGEGYAETEKLGVRRNWAQRAILAPDVVRHIIPEQVGTPGAPAFSLFSKGVKTKRTGALVVLSMRKATVLTILSAFPIPHDVIASVGGLDPVALLAQLAEQFGFELSVAGKRTKFILYERFELKAGSVSEIIRVDTAAPKGMATMFVQRQPGSFEVALAMILDTTRYSAAITRRL
jgi:hypothetical protein